MYQNYIFDLYGTLVDIRTNEEKMYLWEKIVEIYGFYGAMYTPKELKLLYKHYCNEEKEKMNTYQYPEIKLEKVFERLFAERGIEADEKLVIHIGQMFRIISTKYIKLYDGVEIFLKLLKQKKKNVYLLSNAQQIFTQYEMDYLRITEYFDGILFSSDEGCAKPDQAFYERIIKKYNLKIEESIMIGNDFTTDIKGAYDMGMASLYIHSNISPEITGKLHSNYTIMDGDFNKVKQFILKM